MSRFQTTNDSNPWNRPPVMHLPLPGRTRRIAAMMCTAGLFAAAAACAHHHPETGATTTSPGDVATSPASPATHCVATLKPLGDSTSAIQGRADITPGANGGPAAVVLLLSGLRPGATYVWHIRRGSCSAAEVQGPASEYAPLTVDQQGRATSTGTFPMTSSMSGYHIDVHIARGSVVACGDLTPANT